MKRLVSLTMLLVSSSYCLSQDISLFHTGDTVTRTAPMRIVSNGYIYEDFRYIGLPMVLERISRDGIYLKTLFESRPTMMWLSSKHWGTGWKKYHITDDPMFVILVNEYNLGKEHRSLPERRLKFRKGIERENCR